METPITGNVMEETSGGITITGFAPFGTPTDAPLWRLQKKEPISTITSYRGPIGRTGMPTDKGIFAWDERSYLDFSGVPDETAPTLTTVEIVSNNADTTLLKPGNTATISVVSDKFLTSLEATIFGNEATVTKVNPKTWTITYVVTAEDDEGVAPFAINFTDITGRAGVEVTDTTDMSELTYDKTLISLDSAVRDSDTQVTVTLSELALEASITKGNAGGFVAHKTGTPETTYAVSGIAPGATDDEVVLTLADISGSIAEGITITYVAGGNGTVADLAGNAMATDAVGVLIPTWA